MTMLTVASQIVLCLVLAALLGMIIGYLIGRSNCPKETYKALTPDDPHTHDDGGCDEEEETAVAAEETPDAAAAHATNHEAEDDNTAETASLQNDAPQGLLDDQKASSDAAQNKENSEAAEAATEAAADDSDETKGASATAPKAADNAPDADAVSASKEGEGESAATEPTDEDKPAALLDAPREGKADNLKRIKGIGPKIETLLNEVGVYHFDQIAAWTEKEAAWIDHKVSFPGRALRDDWIGQAKLLAEGKETDFSKRVDKGEVASSQ
jgi:NADH-quinone oxidoreductase subunit E